MKKVLNLLTMAMLVITACQPKPMAVTVDIDAEKAAITTLLDKYTTAFTSKDAITIVSLFTDNALVCGTDPKEFWNKQEIIDLWTEAFADTSLSISYSVDKRMIRVNADGNSALVIEQYVMPLMSPIPIRCIYYVVKNEGTWLIDFDSWNFIPLNEDIPRLNKALE